MVGDDKTRFCHQCNKHVHDLSAMVRAEAESFCRENPTACVRFTSNPSGRLLTTEDKKLLSKWNWPIRIVTAFWGFILIAVGCDHTRKATPFTVPTSDLDCRVTMGKPAIPHDQDRGKDEKIKDDKK
jgi:hypothetical protein